MKLPKRILIFAVLIGLLTVFGLNYYIKSLENRQKSQIAYSKVAVAANTIPANIVVTADMIALRDIPAEAVHPNAINSLDKIVGKISKSEIVKDEQILSSRIVVDAAKATLAYRVPEDMRAIAIPISEVSGVAGYINEGDRIDILATYNNKDVNPVSTTYTQLQNVEVAALGSAKISEANKEGTFPTSITVFVKPAQAEVLAYAVSNGILHFTLRSPVNTKKASLKFYNSTNFLTYSER